jgi:hypothetical protein
MDSLKRTAKGARPSDIGDSNWCRGHVPRRNGAWHRLTRTQIEHLSAHRHLSELLAS